MKTIPAHSCTLLLIDLQGRLMPVIRKGAEVVAQTAKLQKAARILEIPVLMTEQNAKGLGPTTPDLAPETVFHKMHFDACREPEFLDRLPGDGAIVVGGCETHVCVQQTVLGLLDAGRTVYLARDATGSRAPGDKETALKRMEAHGAEIVTVEMVLFEWLETCTHPRFREVLALIK